VRDKSLPGCLRVPRPLRSNSSTTRLSALRSSRESSSTDDVFPPTCRQIIKCGGRKRRREEYVSANNQSPGPSPSPSPSRYESLKTDGIDMLPLTTGQKGRCARRKRESKECSPERENSDALSPPPSRSPPQATASFRSPPLRFVFVQTAHNDVASSHVAAMCPIAASRRDPFVLSSLCPGQLECPSSDQRSHHDSTPPRNARQITQCFDRGRSLWQSERKRYQREITPPTSSGDTPCVPPPTQSSFPTRNSPPPHANASPKIPPLHLVLTPSDADSSVGAAGINGALLRYNFDPFVLSSLCPSQPEYSPSDFRPHHDPALPLSARQIAQRVRRRRELQESENGLYHREIAPRTSHGDTHCSQPPLQCSFPTRNDASPGIPPLRFITSTTHNDVESSHVGAPLQIDAPPDNDMDHFVLHSLCPSRPECSTGELTASAPNAKHIVQPTRRGREVKQRERGGLAALRRRDGASFVWRYTFFPPTASASAELSPQKGRWAL
jgi:hypothetical protein